MLNFYGPRVAAHYFMLVFVSTVGTLQIVAIRYQLSAWALFPMRGRRQPGVICGLGLLTGAFAWFVATTPEMLLPGPAGFEISLLFSAAVVLALPVCRLGAILCKWISNSSS